MEITQSDSKESPISRSLIESIIEPLLDKDNLQDNLIDELTNNLKTVSTRHKFLIQLTSVQGKDFKIDNKFGAIWEDNDGYFIVKIPLNPETSNGEEPKEIETIIITIFWLFVS